MSISPISFSLASSHFASSLTIIMASDLLTLINTPSPLSSPTSPHLLPLTSNIQLSDPTITRRSANYSPGICDDDFVQSLNSVFKEKTYTMRAEKLQDYAKQLLKEETNHVAQLELIDTLQRLGVGYLFNTEIKSALNDIKTRSDDSTNIDVEDLHSLSLKFRLMRLHGYMVPQDIFNKFKDDKGNFKECLSNDIKGILSLYEASHLGLVGEDILDQARTFTVSHLKEYVKEKEKCEFERQVEHALDLPLHWRAPILEARWFIDVYEKDEDMNPRLLELAKLNLNISQSIYQTDLKATSRWWNELGMARKLNFSRDRLGECFMWATATMDLPEYGRARDLLTRVGQVTTTVDDVYDVYGTLDELELFTDAVERWDADAVEQLPDYMKLCFLALFNITNQIGYVILKEQGCNVLPYLKGSWAHLCKLYLVEAKWYHTGYTPTLDEYLNIARDSVTAPHLLLHTYVFITPIISKETLEYFKSSPELVRWAATVFRFCDDLATSKDELERGDIPKSIQCYMHETGVSEEDAREHIKGLIYEGWKHMNKDVVIASQFPKSFVNCVLGMLRMTHCFYNHGDAFGAKRGLTLDYFKLFVIEPIL